MQPKSRSAARNRRARAEAAASDSHAAYRSRSKLPLRILEVEFVCFLGLWLYICTLGPVPWLAIVMWVPLFVVFGFVLGLGEAKRG